jgi:hypothetical protein
LMGSKLSEVPGATWEPVDDEDESEPEPLRMVMWVPPPLLLLSWEEDEELRLLLLRRPLASAVEKPAASTAIRTTWKMAVPGSVDGRRIFMAKVTSSGYQMIQPVRQTSAEAASLQFPFVSTKRQ